MSLQQVVTFAASNTTAVAALQPVIANTALRLNATPQAPASVPNGGYITSYTIPNVSRLITLSSTANLSTVNFTFAGLDINNGALTEVLAGPNNATVSTVNNYHTLLSITPSATNGGTVSAGTGATGSTQWITLDSSRNNSQLALIQAVVTGTITYTINGTADRVQYPVNTGGTGGSGIVTPSPNANAIAAFSAKSATVVAQEDLPYSAIKATISASTGGSLVLTILQPGLE